MRAEWQDTLRSTPMRLTLRLVALFLMTSLLTFAATWWLANKTLLDAADNTLDVELDELSASGNAAGITAAVEALSARTDPEDMILHFEGATGATGNYREVLPGSGLREFDPRDGGDRLSDRYIVKSRNVPGGVLTVGQSADAFDELREVFGQVLSFTLLPTVLLVLAAGMISARRSARRLAAIEGTLDRLRGGNLSARLPDMPGPADDLSRVGTGIDRLAEAQQASTEALRQVSADIAHDLKTPIQRLSVQLAEVRDELPDGASTIGLDRAEAEVAGIVSTFQSLLSIAQIEGGSPRARFATVDLSALAATMAEVYEPAAEESGHNLRIDIGSKANVMGDRALLGQIIANLIENALRHTPPGSDVALSVDGSRLTVGDNGPGIPAEEREMVLRRLYRLDRSRSTPGSGLGLSLVDAVVKLHGGTLELQDNAPGLRIVVRLPAA
ncbi:Signal transduction histidine kinase [Paracoccus aminovorans]|uniref:histidine kinase n=1 Tax=Paracoccus aminovorans TaxID=34004 RepID=A0A1I3E2Q4_9RHOB|nr:HAMP domain-containing sensor histidine kinase [Paracoccus aminovorans]CQR84647.1 histidine kinase [Paracoccus aminovorans]SFH93254.1 Signal transduction histidine kinase [Paracoccus aminovorans]